MVCPYDNYRYNEPMRACLSLIPKQSTLLKKTKKVSDFDKKGQNESSNIVCSELVRYPVLVPMIMTELKWLLCWRGITHLSGPWACCSGWSVCLLVYLLVCFFGHIDTQVNDLSNTKHVKI